MASKHPRRRSSLFPKSDEKRKQHRRYARASGPSLRLESLERQIVFAAGLSLDVSDEGKDASIQPGPSVAPGTAIEWIYQVTNTGNRPIVSMNLADDAGTPYQPADDLNITPVTVATSTTDVPATGVLLATLDGQNIAKMIVDPIRPRVYMTSADENETIVFDTQTLQVTQRIRIGSQSHGLDLSANAEHLYVTHDGNGRGSGRVAVIRTEDGSVLRDLGVDGQQVRKNRQLGYEHVSFPTRRLSGPMKSPIPATFRSRV